MRPCVLTPTRCSRSMRAASATAIGAIAASVSANKTLPRVAGAPSASAMPWYTSTAAMPSRKRSAKSASRPSTDVGSERTRNVASSATASTSTASLADACRASTTMKAKEIGSPTRSGGRSSISSPAAIAPPMTARGAHGLPGWAISIPIATAAPPARRTSIRTQRVTIPPPAPRRSGARVLPSRCRPPVGRPPTRGRRPRGRRRSARRDARSRR